MHVSKLQLKPETPCVQERGPGGELRPYSCQVALHRAVYDPYSKAVYFVEGETNVRAWGWHGVSDDLGSCRKVGVAARLRAKRAAAAE